MTRFEIIQRMEAERDHYWHLAFNGQTKEAREKAVIQADTIRDMIDEICAPKMEA